MKNLNLNALRVFSVVAAQGNLQRAADVLNLSRGAVSQRIKQLEVDLGVTLFERQARGVALTADGARCRKAVDEALALLDTALADITSPTDHITLHLGPSFASKSLMPRLEKLQNSFPRLSISTEVHDRRLPRALGRNEIAIWPGSAPDLMPSRDCAPLAPLALAAVSSPRLDLPSAGLSPAELLGYPLLQDANRHWERLIRDAGSNATPRTLNFDRSALALDAAMQGHGLAIAPLYLVASDVAEGRLSVVWKDPEPAMNTLFVSWSRDHSGEGAVGRIVHWFRAAFAHSAQVMD